MKARAGFTLVELMVTVAIAAILLSLGVPSFQEYIRNSRLVSRTNDFIGALHLARSEAIKRGGRVTLCKSADGATCASSGGYEQGWIVFVDANNDATVSSSTAVIRAYEAIPPGAGITLTGNSNVESYVSYTADGKTKLLSGGFQAGTLTVCMAPTKAKRIVMSSSGRARTEDGPCS